MQNQFQIILLLILFCKKFYTFTSEELHAINSFNLKKKKEKKIAEKRDEKMK